MKFFFYSKIDVANFAANSTRRLEIRGIVWTYNDEMRSRFSQEASMHDKQRTRCSCCEKHVADVNSLLKGDQLPKRSVASVLGIL
mmetsp:Transcript_43453/g.70504  ORF Transcript_43453/g.70504 Transcript_43453/m.70504 type:complete len:85 (+) Transcript_43453:906-1160(+)